MKSELGRLLAEMTPGGDGAAAAGPVTDTTAATYRAGLEAAQRLLATTTSGRPSYGPADQVKERNARTSYFSFH